MQRIFVTGGNTGIGFALCRQLAVENKCHVYLGSRSIQKGEAAVKRIIDSAPGAQIEFIQIDVADAKSVTTAAQTVQTRLGSDKLYALVNNAGTGLAHGVSAETVVNVNLFGVHRVTEAFLPLLASSGARIVNCGSGAGPMFLDGKMGSPTNDEKVAFQDPAITWARIEELTESRRNGVGFPNHSAYGFSKAAVAAYTMLLAREHPAILSSSLSPGFINTAIVTGFGATKTPEEGTVSYKHCLFNELGGNGWFFGSDAKRSPLYKLRNPGEPEYTGA